MTVNHPGRTLVRCQTSGIGAYVETLLNVTGLKSIATRFLIPLLNGTYIIRQKVP